MTNPTFKEVEGHVVDLVAVHADKVARYRLGSGWTVFQDILDSMERAWKAVSVLNG
jgi:hypothetical protein